MNKAQLSRTYMTTGIVAVLFIIFLVEIFAGGSSNSVVLYRFGAMNNYIVVSAGQWWRLFTAQFLHIGLMHLVSNVVFIYYLGQLLEQLFGHWRFLTLYLLAGIGGNLLSLACGSDNTISAGASTALFGLLGAMLAMSWHNRQNPYSRFLGRQAFMLVAINLILDVFTSGIDIMGHIGGVVTGFLLAILLGSHELASWPRKARVVAAALLIFYVVATVRIGMVISY